MDLSLILRKEGDADAGGQEQLAPAQRKGGTQAGEDLPRHPGGILRLGDVRQHDDELVTAHPGDPILLSERGPQSAGNLPQQTVSFVMAQGVVDVLESVQVNEQHRDPAIVAFGVA